MQHQCDHNHSDQCVVYHYHYYYDAPSALEPRFPAPSPPLISASALPCEFESVRIIPFCLMMPDGELIPFKNPRVHAILLYLEQVEINLT